MWGLQVLAVNNGVHGPVAEKPAESAAEAEGERAPSASVEGWRGLRTGEDGQD